MNKKVLLILILCSLSFLLTACWDEIQIEDRGFVIGSAIDVDGEGAGGKQRIKETNQFVIPAGINTAGKGGGGGQQKPFMNLSESGESIFASDRKMGTKTSKLPFFGHLKVIVLSMDLAKTPHLFENLMDVFIRDIEMRRGIKVIAADGEAKDILGITPESEQLPAIYINTLLENSSENSSVFKPIMVGDIHEHLLNKASFTIPRFSSSEKEINYKGAAVYHGAKQKVVGTLNDKEMVALNLLIGKSKAGMIEFSFDNRLMTYAFRDAKSKIIINTKDKENLDITVNIGLEGRVAEILGKKELKSSKDLAEVERKIAAKVEKMTKQTIERGQKELNTDIFEIGKNLKQKHYDTWEKMKDNWEKGENYFAKSKFHVSVEVRIRQPGNAQ